MKSTLIVKANNFNVCKSECCLIFKVVLFLDVLVISTFIGALLFVFIEVPWANFEKWFFSLILGGGRKAKKV